MSNHNKDEHVDVELFDCVDFSSPKSFFLFAGAGAGKTRSLVKLLNNIDAKYGRSLYENSQRVAVITYTNAACDEIKHRLNYNRLFSVSTIHSFCWDLIKNFSSDVKDFLRDSLSSEIQELEVKEAKGRKGTKASVERLAKIENKTKRLQKINEISQFKYSPNGKNSSFDSLNHTEVISIASHFLCNEENMALILVKKFPILLIDESQDTNKDLMNAIISVQKANSSSFSVGLLGDMMQRVYFDGVERLDHTIPSEWATPVKKLNQRCPKRIVKLLNEIRKDVDAQSQEARSDSNEGILRLFISPCDGIEKKISEVKARDLMAEISSDEHWKNGDSVQTLILEHHMAASRLNFINFFDPIHSVEKYKTGILDGTLSAISFLWKVILPLKNAYIDEKDFEVIKIIKEYSVLYDKELFKSSTDQISLLHDINTKVERLCSLWTGNNPNIGQVVEVIKESGLFSLPEIIEISRSVYMSNSVDDSNDSSSKEIECWLKVFEVSFEEVESYYNYINGESGFETHQGVKGLEYDRVLAILDDSSSRGFLFKYEKLFGVEELSDNDHKNIDAGKDSVVDRARRLFYVACSRSQNSLGVLCYTKDPSKVREFALESGWFEEDEIIMINE